MAIKNKSLIRVAFRYGKQITRLSSANIPFNFARDWTDSFHFVPGIFCGVPLWLSFTLCFFHNLSQELALSLFHNFDICFFLNASKLEFFFLLFRDSNRLAIVSICLRILVLVINLFRLSSSWRHYDIEFSQKLSIGSKRHYLPTLMKIVSNCRFFVLNLNDWLFLFFLY